MATKTAKGIETRNGILSVAADIASVEGLAGLTLGGLADELSMSKSGLFAHFGSKEELQIATIEYARQIYLEQVIRPATAHMKGIETLYALCDAYVALMERGVFPGGCFFAAAMAEFDARPGAVRDVIARLQRSWLDLLATFTCTATRRISRAPGGRWKPLSPRPQPRPDVKRCRC